MQRAKSPPLLASRVPAERISNPSTVIPVARRVHRALQPLFRIDRTPTPMGTGINGVVLALELIYHGLQYEFRTTRVVGCVVVHEVVAVDVD